MRPNKVNVKQPAKKAAKKTAKKKAANNAASPDKNPVMLDVGKIVNAADDVGGCGQAFDDGFALGKKQGYMDASAEMREAHEAEMDENIMVRFLRVENERKQLDAQIESLVLTRNRLKLEETSLREQIKLIVG